MKIIFYPAAVQQQANDLLEDIADAVAGVERCAACHQQFAACDCPDLVAAGVVPAMEG